MLVPFPLVLVSREGKLEVAGLPLVSRSAPQHCPDPLSSSVHPCRPQRTSLECSRNDVLFTLKVSLGRRERRGGKEPLTSRQQRGPALGFRSSARALTEGGDAPPDWRGLEARPLLSVAGTLPPQRPPSRLGNRV